MKKCPFCSKYLMHQRAVICIHCGRNVVTGEAIPVAAPSKKPSAAPPPKISPVPRPPKVSSDAPASEKPPRGTGRKVFYMLKLTGAIALVIFAGACLFEAYKNYKTENAELAAPVAGTSTGSAKPVPQPEVLAGNAVETEEKVDEAAAEAMLKMITTCNADASMSILQPGSKAIKVSLFGQIEFKPEKEQPLRVKVYRSTSKDGKYSLIFNDLLKDFKKPAVNVTTRDVRPDIEEMKKSLARMKEANQRFSNPAAEQAVVRMEQSLKQRLEIEERIKKNGGQVVVPKIANDNRWIPRVWLNFRISDVTPLDCASNNVFYKIKLCSDTGLMLIESNPMKVPLVPRVVMADDLKTWTWTPFFPGKDPLDGVLQNGQTAIPVSNAPVEGQLAENMTKQNRFNPPVYFKSTSSERWSWRYSRSQQVPENSFSLDATEIRPVFNGSCFFEVKGKIELKSLKIDGRKVNLYADNYNSTVMINKEMLTRPNQKVWLNYPGTPVAELEFAYGGKTNTLRVQLPPVPTGLRAVLLDDGSVKLTWDALAERIDPRQFTAPPDIKLLRDQKVIHTCDINQTEFIDKQTEPGRMYTYSIVLDDTSAKVQLWTKENGLTETKILLRDLGNPFPDKFQATVFIYPDKPPVRPVRISFWEPALCYERTGSPGMQLFSAAVRKLSQEAIFEVLDRTSRNNVIEEKVLTMSYEKSIMIQSLPGDFTVLVRDYSRESGNGVDLWLTQNKRFDYENVKSLKHRSQPAHVENIFFAWRIGSISAEELKIPEKAAELSDKLVAEIKERVFFKGTIPQKDASAPTRFVFNPLKAVRQKTMVVDDKAIGESIMIGLSNLMPGSNIMTRDNWKAIFSEQDLMRRQGEKLENDISGTVLISGRVWQENDKKQYAFTLTDIRSGICAGAIQCSGTVEEVTAKLADACKKIKLVTPPGSEANEQTKAELQRERWTIFDCFMKRFGLSNTENTYKSLTSRQEMNIPEFAEKQWQLGNRENAVRILEKTLKTSKSCWRQLNGYYCKMGNYTRALQIVEAVMQQQASSALIPEYYRLRAMVARNAPPEEISKETNEAAGQEVLVGIKMDGVLHKIIPNRVSNENLDADYSERLAAIGQEWNPGGECRTCTKYFKFGNLKYTEYLKRDEIQKYGIWATAFEDRNSLAKKHDDVYISLVLWESEPFFDSNDSIVLTRSLRLAVSSGFPQRIIEGNYSNQFDRTSFSPIRAYFAIAKNPDMKLVPVEKNYSAYTALFAACDSGRKFLEIKLKQIIKERQDKYRKIKLADMICIAILARLGNSTAEDLLSEIDTVELPSSFENLHNLQTRYEPYDLLAFKVYRGDRTACELALKSLRADRCCLGYRNAMADIYYLMAKAGRKEIVAAMLTNTECKDQESIAAIRWGDQKMLKSLLLEHPELFELDIYFYLIDGLNDPVFRDDLLNHQAVLQNVSDEYRIKSVLWLGKPLPELYREMTLNGKRGE